MLDVAIVLIGNLFYFYEFEINIWNDVQNVQKNSLKKCVFVNSALKIQFHVLKNTLLYCFFGDFVHWAVITTITKNEALDVNLL